MDICNIWSKNSFCTSVAKAKIVKGDFSNTPNLKFFCWNLQLPYTILNRTDEVWKISIPIIDIDTTLESVMINVEIRN